MPSEKRWKRLVFKWTAPKGFIAVALFFAIALLIEYLVVYFFTLSGLTDKFLFKIFTINISPLFHLMPLGVIVVLVSSWTHLTKYIAVVPHRISPAKKTPEPRRRRYPRARKKRFKLLRKFFERVDQTIEELSRRIGAAVLRIPGVSYLQKRLFFTRAAVKSTATILAVFLVSVLTLYILAYPKLIYDLAAGIYEANPSFHEFVLETIEMGKGTVQALSPIGWLASAIDNALRAAAPAFRNALEGLGRPIAEPLAKLDLVWIYALCQNVAAWASAVVALAYGEYTSRLYRIRKPR